MHLEGRVDYSDTQKRDMILNAQKQLLAKVSTPYRKNGGGLLLRIDDMGQKLRQSQIEEEKEEQPDIFHQKKRRDSISEDELRDMFKVLKKQKEGIDVLTTSINESTRQLMIMEREVDINCINSNAHILK